MNYFVLSSFAIILTRKGELVDLLLLSFGYLVTVNPHSAVDWSAVCDCGTLYFLIILTFCLVAFSLASLYVSHHNFFLFYFIFDLIR